MARVPPQKSAEPARFRLIVMEAEIPAGSDLTQIVHAVQNAVRPTVAIVPARTARALNGPVHNGTQAEPMEQEIELPTVDQAEEPETVPETPRAPRPARRAAPKTPDVLNNLDLTSSVAFADYAAQKNPQSNSDRFLEIAAWFNEHRGVTGVTAEHIYTCYRHVKWPCNILPEFSQPLRSLKHGDAQNGFVLGLLGQGRVDKMGK
jgi:hypothetical protein